MAASWSQWALRNVDHADQTVGNILKANGIEPAPQRKRTTTPLPAAPNREGFSAIALAAPKKDP
jgi:hypothetical protein